MILPWDARRIEEDAGRRDLELTRTAADPYNRAARGLISGVTRASVAANPTTGAAATRSAMTAAAPAAAGLTAQGLAAEAAAARAANENTERRARASAEAGANFLGLGLNAGGGMLGTLLGGLGGGGAAPAGGGGGLAGLAPMAGSIAGGSMGGPLGSMVGGQAGRMAGGLLSPPPPSTPETEDPMRTWTEAGNDPTTRGLPGGRFNPMANPGAMAAAPAVVGPVTGMAPFAPPAPAPMGAPVGTPPAFASAPADIEEILRRYNLGAGGANPLLR